MSEVPTAPSPDDPYGLLSPEALRQLREDLAEMARLRRRAEVESRNLAIG